MVQGHKNCICAMSNATNRVRIGLDVLVIATTSIDHHRRSSTVSLTVGVGGTASGIPRESEPDCSKAKSRDRYSRSWFGLGHVARWGQKNNPVLGWHSGASTGLFQRRLFFSLVFVKCVVDWLARLVLFRRHLASLAFVKHFLVAFEIRLGHLVAIRACHLLLI